MAPRTNVEVDQSGKVENLTDHTALAFSDGIQYAILIPARVKRAGVQVLRRRGVDKKLGTLHLFAAGLYLLLTLHLEQINLVVIDTEYAGQEETIRARLLRSVRRTYSHFHEDKVVFRRIGKKSPAHKRAWSVHRGKARADRVIQEAELVNALK